MIIYYLNSIFLINSIDFFIDSYVKIFSVNTGKYLQFNPKDFNNQPTFKNIKGIKKFLLKKYNDEYTLKIFNLYFCIDNFSEKPCYLTFKNTKFGFYILDKIENKCLNLSLNNKCNENYNLNYLFDLMNNKKRKKCNEYEYEIKVEKIKNINEVFKKYPLIKQKPIAKKWFKSMWKGFKKPKISLKNMKGLSKFSWPNLFC